MVDEERIERLERYCDQLHNRIIDLEREKAREWDVDMLMPSNVPQPSSVATSLYYLLEFLRVNNTVAACQYLPDAIRDYNRLVDNHKL